MLELSFHLPIKRKLEEMPIQLHFKENVLTSGHLILNNNRWPLMAVSFTEELIVMPVAFPKTYILSSQPNLKDTETSKYLFQNLLESSPFAVIVAWRPVSCMAWHTRFMHLDYFNLQIVHLVLRLIFKISDSNVVTKHLKTDLFCFTK